MKEGLDVTRLAILIIAIVAGLSLIASPVLAGDEQDARSAACNSYAQVKVEGVAAASPRTDPTPPTGIRPRPPGSVQAPGTSAGQAADPLLRGMASEGLGDSEYQQAFRSCMEKLMIEGSPAASPSTDRAPSPGVRRPGPIQAPGSR